MGSWDEHLQSNRLMGSGLLSKAAIVHNSGAMCANHELNLRQEEIVALIQAFNDASKRGGSVLMEGTKYLETGRHENMIHFKVISSSNDTKLSVCGVATDTLVIIGMDKDGNCKGNLSKLLFDCASYFKSVGC